MARVRVMGTTQLRPGGKGTSLGPAPAQAAPDQAPLLASPQSPSHLLRCRAFEDPTSYKGVMLEDRGTGMGPVTQQCGAVHRLAPSCISSVPAPGEARGAPGLVSGGSGLPAFIWPPTSHLLPHS